MSQDIASQNKTSQKQTQWRDLEIVSLKVREHIVRMSTDGGCFIGASLSAVEVIVYLYNQYLNLPSPTDPERDYFFLSKGHDVPALYGTLVEKGVLESSRLANHLKTTDNIYWHPNRSIPFVEFHSGSLGHLLSVAIGVALDCKMRKQNNRIIVMTGDGELNEGSNWEALLVANAYKLDNLTVVVDRNQFQANIRTEELIPLEPLADKFQAFGVNTQVVNGHDFADLDKAFNAEKPTGPRAIIAQTMRGKGLPSIQERADRWFCNFSHEEVTSLLQELHGNAPAELHSETLVVR